MELQARWSSGRRRPVDHAIQQHELVEAEPSLVRELPLEAVSTGMREPMVQAIHGRQFVVDQALPLI